MSLQQTGFFRVKFMINLIFVSTDQNLKPSDQNIVDHDMFEDLHI